MLYYRWTLKLLEAQVIEISLGLSAFRLLETGQLQAVESVLDEFGLALPLFGRLGVLSVEVKFLDLVATLITVNPLLQKPRLLNVLIHVVRHLQA